MKCKYPNEACGNQTFYNRKIYCDNANGFCSLHDKEPPMTNGDKIRSMTDEELADFIAFGLPEYINDWPDLMLDWLRQPSEEKV